MTDSAVVTWWGHATTTIELLGRRFLTDPVLTPRVAHLSRLSGPLPRPAAKLADAVVISHLHHDHLDVRSLRLLADDIPIIAPRGTLRMLRRTAPDVAHHVLEVQPGDRVQIGPVEVVVVDARHDGRRSAVSRHRGPALGFVLQGRPGADAPRVWFAGDTGLFAGMTDIGPVDVAIVPIGGWGPGLGPLHLDPAQAAEAVRRVGARHAVPIHYGTFWPTGLRRAHPVSYRRDFLEPGERFAEAMLEVCPSVTLHVLEIGQTVSIPQEGSQEDGW